jgi:hypothetical protein
MRQSRLILALLFVFAFGSSALAEDVLIERYANSEVYRVNSTTKKLVMGGDIENALPFDGGGYTPWNLVFAEGTPMGNWTWLGKGTIGYLIKPSISTVRMYPVRGDPTKFIEIAPLAAQPSIVNQISAKSLELYVDQPNTRWSLSMTPQGFKPNILLKPGYSGDGTFQFRFELNGGLTLDGTWIMDGSTRLLKMHNPFLVDAEGINRAVDESLVDGVVTLTADLNGLTFPVLVDPTLGPVNPDMDALLYQGTPTSGWGQANNLQFFDSTNLHIRNIVQHDASAIPPTATVTSATWEAYQLTVGGAGDSTDILELNVYDWEDAGNNTANAEANWNNYKDPNVAWPGGAGALGDTDATYKASANIVGQLQWTVFTITDLVQDQVTNHGGLVNFMWKYTTEANTAANPGFASLEYVTASLRPKLTVVYTEAAADILLRPWCSKKGASNEKAICALPYHIN